MTPLSWVSSSSSHIFTVSYAGSFSPASPLNTDSVSAPFSFSFHHRQSGPPFIISVLMYPAIVSLLTSRSTYVRAMLPACPTGVSLMNPNPESLSRPSQSLLLLLCALSLGMVPPHCSIRNLTTIPNSSLSLSYICHPPVSKLPVLSIQFPKYLLNRPPSISIASKLL